LRKIAIINFKGGTGKTTTAVSLAAGLALEGRKVLLIDNDPSGNATLSLGASNSKTLYNVLIDKDDPKTCITEARANLYLLPADSNLAKADKAMAGESYRETILKEAMKGVRGYDFILIDNAPTFNVLNENSLNFATEVLIPVSTEFLALAGLKFITDTLNTVRRHNQKLKVSKIVPTFYDSRESKSPGVFRALLEQFGKDMVARPIRSNTKLSEAPGLRKTIFEYAPKSYGAIDYTNLVKEVLNSG
jgi:chromosome partitioning protein